MTLNMVDSTVDSYTCPPLTDADYLTSSRLASPRQSRKELHSPPLPGPSFGGNGGNMDDKMMVDPRRFTPTLHANLVSEILALRREVESKNTLVLNLEEHMLQIKDENTKLHEIVASNSKEKRSLKRQMDALENGTLAAIEDLARERDQANETVTEIKSQLERSQKKVRNQEEENRRAQEIWQRDNENWDTEKRILERKVHVVEGRLKTVLTEVATQSMPHRRSIDNGPSWVRDRPSSRASGRRSAASFYRDSISAGASSGAKTLADELNLETVSDPDSDDCGSPEALPEEAEFPRSYSSQSNRQSIKARKLLGLPIDPTEDAGDMRDSLHTGYAHALNTYAIQQNRPVYSDTATQYSPPPSPKLIPEQQRLSTITEYDGDSLLDELRLRPTSSGYDRPKSVTMVSSSCQTIETPLSPPETPIHSRSESREMHRPTMTTSSTQTSENLFTATMSLKPNAPTIAIRPATPQVSVVYRGNLRDASCQAHVIGEVKSTGVQTESIRTDERLTKLPAHLHPAIIRPITPTPSPIPSPAVELQNQKELGQPPIPARPKLKINSQRSVASKSILRRSIEKQRLDAPDSGDDLSDDSFLQRPPLKKTLSKVQDSWKIVASPVEEPENMTDTEETPPKLPDLDFGDVNLRASKADEKQSPRRLRGNSEQILLKPDFEPNQPKDLSKDVRANIGRARSPSEPIRPNRISGQPYPVPDRSSSRKFPWLTDDGMESPTPRSSRYSSSSRGSRKRPTVRKSRSEINNRRLNGRPRSPSPQPFDILTESLANIPPPLPENEITSPRAATMRQHSRFVSQTQSVPSQSESVRSDQTTIVDSIAQTMIGEWMFKYVRRRKSFGLPDEPGTGENSVNGGTRHQRWVWVAPYERAVMWSSKQPTSGTALMGKTGRKLVISSVLDVHDDSPMPKGAPSTSHFGRSILILTPQRALKFTATSLERHNVWMNALTFLSQGPVDFADIIDQPPVPASTATETSRRESVVSHRPGKPSIDGSLHRSKINDSIRIAKGKERPLPAQRANTNPVQSENQNYLRPSDGVDGAEAPVVPRTSADTRRRSTAPNKSHANSVRSYTSSNKASLHSLRSRVSDTFADPLPRSTMRLWSGRPQRVVSDETPSQDAIRAPSRQSNYRDENLFEAVGTMRMSAFVQDTSGDYISNQQNSMPKRVQPGTRSFSADVLESHYATDAPREKRSDKVANTRKHNKSRGHQTRLEEDVVPQLPRILVGGGDPFEGF